MIKVILRGGLGNQMFQYAAGLAVAKKNNDRLVLDTTYLNDRFPRRQFTYRRYDLDVFTLAPEFTRLSTVSERVPLPGVWLGADLALALAGGIAGVRFVKERQPYVFDPEVFRAGPRGAVLWGFWQNPAYFKEIEEDVRRTFVFREPLMEAAAHIAEEIRNSNSVAIHVRRGDYTLPKYQGTYGDTNMAYYQSAIATIVERVKDPVFFVFSDDPEWCRANLKIARPVTYLDRSSAGPKAAFHLQLMALCKHNIIANSTFSWWGAWLNRNPGKIVVAPKRWHANLTKGGLTLEQWIMV